MVDPVVAADGHTYERDAIEQWLASKGTSPLDPSLAMTSQNLYPNRAALASIEALVESGEVDGEAWKTAKKKADLAKAKIFHAEGRVLEAANLGLPEAQGVMALRYAHGIDGVIQDYAQAFSWAQKAAVGGDLEGHFHVAEAYQNGRGVEKDNAKALLHFKEVIASADCNWDYEYESYHSIINILLVGGYGVEKNVAEGAIWMKRHADMGMYNSQYDYALMVLKGSGGVAVDLVEARTYFEMACESEDEMDGGGKAYYELGKMMVNGEGGPTEVVEGSKKIIAAAENGFDLALEYLRSLGRRD